MDDKLEAWADKALITIVVLGVALVLLLLRIVYDGLRK